VVANKVQQMMEERGIHIRHHFFFLKERQTTDTLLGGIRANLSEFLSHLTTFLSE
jgi:hypothetical protein